ncbi:hypothetical protein D3C75_504900 [compost metagenome]
MGRSHLTAMGAVIILGAGPVSAAVLDSAAIEQCEMQAKAAIMVGSMRDKGADPEYVRSTIIPSLTQNQEFREILISQIPLAYTLYPDARTSELYAIAKRQCLDGKNVLSRKEGEPITVFKSPTGEESVIGHWSCRNDRFVWDYKMSADGSFQTIFLGHRTLNGTYSISGNKLKQTVTYETRDNIFYPQNETITLNIAFTKIGPGVSPDRDTNTCALVAEAPTKSPLTKAAASPSKQVIAGSPGDSYANTQDGEEVHLGNAPLYVGEPASKLIVGKWECTNDSNKFHWTEIYDDKGGFVSKNTKVSSSGKYTLSESTNSEGESIASRTYDRAPGNQGFATKDDRVSLYFTDADKRESALDKKYSSCTRVITKQ